MKRRDAIKTAIGSVLGALFAPFVAKAPAPDETVYFKGKPLVTVPNMDDSVFVIHTFQMKNPRPHFVMRLE